MGQLNRLDQLTEFQLTNAIEKAATLAVGSTEDRSQILAHQLDLADVPKHLTKLAAQAFNRRLAVVTLGKRSDETKADQFPLADINKVAALRGVQDQMTKAASCSGDFLFSIELPKSSNELHKAASVPTQEPELSAGKFMAKLSSRVDKGIIEFERAEAELQQAQSQLERMKKKAVAMLQNNEKLSRQLATVFGDTYNEIFKGKLPDSALKKSASYVVLPANATVQFVQKVIKQADSVKWRTEALMTKGAALLAFTENAAKLDSIYRDARLKGLIKESSGYTMLKDIASNAISVPVVTALTAGKGAIETGADIMSAANSQSSRYSVNPSSAITGALLNTDRYDDKVMRLIDTLADRDFAGYPAKDIENAVEHVLIQNPHYLSPRFKQHLKAAINTRLLQGGKTNEAAQAAQATTAKALTAVDKGRAATAPASAVEALGSVQAQAAPLLGDKFNIKELTNKLDIGSPFAVDPQKILDQADALAVAKAKEKVDAMQQERQARLAMMQEYMANRQKAIQQLALSAVRNRNAIGRKFKDVKSLDALPLYQKIRALQEGQADLSKLTPDELSILMANLQTQSKKGKK